MEDYKWASVALLGLAAVTIASSWTESLTAQSAMEHGYVQVVDEKSQKVLWVKPK